MAPVAPSKPSSSSSSKRLSARAKVRARLSSTGPLAPKTFRPNAVIADGFLNSKRDKRQIKHSALLSRIQKSAPSSASTKNRRRRSSKKLVTTLESLGDALDDILDEVREADAAAPAEGKIRHKSLRSRPGALKRKERVVKSEMERFGKSLAHLARLPATTSQTEPTLAEAQKGDGNAMEMAGDAPPPKAAGSGQWAALRQFISSTMEQNPAFVKKD